MIGFMHSPEPLLILIVFYGIKANWIGLYHAQNKVKNHIIFIVLMNKYLQVLYLFFK